MTVAHPSGAELLQIESRVRRNGSGIEGGDLCGCWVLQQTWPKGSRQAPAASTWLLRSLGAQLEINQPDPTAADLTIVNRVVLGPLQLRFCGSAALQGRRPLMQFWFTTLELVWNAQVLWQRSLSQPNPKRLPFFALIERNPSGWLAARGRGGGLALWLLDAEDGAGAN